MLTYPIRIEAVEVRTESGVCPGMAQTRQGETHILTGRTPSGEGMCANSLNALYPMATAMRLTDKMSWEKKDFFEITCPHGRVVWRISRVRETSE
jgi:uncharacterized repeat protein (TIGR04076 family)